MRVGQRLVQAGFALGLVGRAARSRQQIVDELFGEIEMNKILALTAGTALTVALATAAAKPLAILGLASLVVTVWAATFQDTYSAGLFVE